MTLSAQLISGADIGYYNDQRKGSAVGGRHGWGHGDTAQSAAIVRILIFMTVISSYFVFVNNR